jgi:hypothetical protein
MRHVGEGWLEGRLDDGKRVGAGVDIARGAGGNAGVQELAQVRYWHIELASSLPLS